MYSSLLDAPVNQELTILAIEKPPLGMWLQRMGLFVGSQLTRHDKEINYHPVRVRGSLGDVVVPAGLGIKIFVHLEDGVKKPLVEMARKEVGHIESMSCGQGCITALAHLGIAENTDVTFIRALPHMDYITVIDRQERTRLSEGEAARIWGAAEGEEATQFYFATRNKPFLVEEIIGGKKITQHLKTHGVSPGRTLILEAIEQANELHAPGEKHITISSPGGLRLYLNPNQAEQIMVRATASKVAASEAG